MFLMQSPRGEHGLHVSLTVVCNVTTILKQNEKNQTLPVNQLLLQPSPRDLTSLYSALSRVPFKHSGSPCLVFLLLQP